MIQLSQTCHSDLSSCRFLTALPVYNEARHVTSVLDEVVKFATDVLVVDDGSTDGTRELLKDRADIHLLSHRENRGYGAALKSAFDFAIHHRYDLIVTIDCDGQHEPQRIGQMAAACRHADIASGSRYLVASPSMQDVPGDRLKINQTITKELNQQLGLKLTDAFCGFKAYRTRTLACLELTETGYAMPLELWVQAAEHDLHITEVPVPLIYLDEDRSFGGALDAAEIRLNYYREVIARARRSAAIPGLVETDTQAASCFMQNCS
ncbi:glycosyltransferase family 2 protein [Bythopirellula polymerisocia]|uniref:Undecaprenyl-phosphate mannosyltransferase n=1 Tax=Bythopirellula polymerisocia TaxID=2528003 RepID=A0A5C6CNK5_9BACT|nr:glycosyltransferase family 2 protein [Bythopirellula polymerisocia]TWU26110.1 Undecaprenyl-phosphate mannosyltransferase [Bythopirellula polymerisocia]